MPAFDNSNGSDLQKREKMDRRQFFLAGMTFAARLQSPANSLPSWLELQGQRVTIDVDKALALKVRRRGGPLLWQTSEGQKPEAVLLSAGAPDKQGRTLEFMQAASRQK